MVFRENGDVLVTFWDFIGCESEGKVGNLEIVVLTVGGPVSELFLRPGDLRIV